MNTVTATFEHPGKLTTKVTIQPDSAPNERALMEVFKHFEEGHDGGTTEVTADFVNERDNELSSPTYGQPIQKVAALHLVHTIKTDAHTAHEEAQVEAAKTGSGEEAGPEYVTQAQLEAFGHSLVEQFRQLLKPTAALLNEAGSGPPAEFHGLTPEPAVEAS